jgi:hypothetical protein
VLCEVLDADAPFAAEESMKDTLHSLAALNRSSLRSLPTYQLGREHAASCVSDFRRFKFKGVERQAYLLGRREFWVEKLFPNRRVGSRA